ncbi:YceI family protein [Spirosoma endbachense]|uniref:YceI family protein n=1 Tax=Spirosoma endbachense TaxID=2666025 RepID=A0A6P1W4L0_9BACT|nr:YceI family protein [Spirosoma endbachense]QHV98860.1 YceI family protein [Spirosoma endbachense]
MKKLALLSAMALSAFLWGCKKTDDVVATVYELDDTKSVAEWKGHLRTGYFNEGSIRVQSKNLTSQNGKISGGIFSIPLSSLVNYNLPTDSLKQQLVHHLQSADFFNMAVHPAITYTITSVTSYTGSTPNGIDGANYQVNGDLTMLGKTYAVNFPAKIDLTNNQIMAEGVLKVDRTKWGITYASDPTLPDANFIQPDIDIHLKLVGSKK